MLLFEVFWVCIDVGRRGLMSPFHEMYQKSYHMLQLSQTVRAWIICCKGVSFLLAINSNLSGKTLGIFKNLYLSKFSVWFQDSCSKFIRWDLIVRKFYCADLCGNKLKVMADSVRFSISLL